MILKDSLSPGKESIFWPWIMDMLGTPGVDVLKNKKNFSGHGSG